MATATPPATTWLTWPGATGLARRLGLDTLYLTTGLPLGILTFTVVVTGWSLSLGLAITLIGLPLALVTVALSRALGTVERRRAALVLGEPIAARYRSWTEGSIWKRLGAVFADPTTWKDLAWHLLLLPVGIAGFTIAVTTWGTTLGLLLMPAWWWMGSRGWEVDLGLFSVDGWPEAFAALGIGVLSIPLTVGLVRGCAAASGALALARWPVQGARRVEPARLVAAEFAGVGGQHVEHLVHAVLTEGRHEGRWRRVRTPPAAPSSCAAPGWDARGCMPR